MINQVAPVSQKTLALTGINKGLAQARHIQAKLKEGRSHDTKPESGILWNPDFSAPYLVPIIRWIE